MNLKSFPLKTLLSFSSPSFSSYPPLLYSLSIFISHFSTSQSQTFRSRSSLPRHEEESRHVKVSVWWDFENCQLPTDVNVFKIAHMITAAVRTNGIKGPVQITAFGDIVQISRTNQEALSSTGINIAHIPNGGKNSADRSLLVDLMYWISQNPPPAHLFLISGDRDFASVLHKLRMNNYNVLLASPETAPSVLCSAASIMWNWKALLKGKNLIGNHYNQPPDGPYGSWYGHYNGPLEDPFLVEQPACPQTKELSKGFSDSKLRPVPKAVIKQIRQILNSYPKGISISDFRSELIRSKVGLDKDLYGYKKFSHFLLSIPHILRLHSKRDGPVCKNGDGLTASSRARGDDMSVAGALNGKSGLHQYPEVEAGVTPKRVQQSPPENVNLVKVNAESEKPPEEVQQPLPVGQKIPEASSNQVTGSHQATMLEQDSASEVSFIRKGWQRWLCGSNHNSETKSHDLPLTISTSSIENKVSGKANENHSGKRSGLFNRIANWCKFWRSSQDSETSSNQSREKHNQKNANNSLKHEFFSQGSFWKAMEILMDSPRGSLLVTRSRTRKEMAENLLKEGPLPLRSLNNTDLLQLVDLLISDKKWIKECPFQTSPFRITRAVEESLDLDHSHAANGLRSILMGTPPHASLKPKQEGEKKLQNDPHSGVSSTIINKKSSDHSRCKILADCQNLVKNIVKEHPDGCNMGLFKRLFLERYGYSLDTERLGYKKLASLLATMPGIKIEYCYIVPASMVTDNSGLETAVLNILENTSHASGNTACELPDASVKGDGFDLCSALDELGPVYTSLNRKGRQPVLEKQRTEDARITYPDCEPLVSDDEISDSLGKSQLQSNQDSI